MVSQILTEEKELNKKEKKRKGGRLLHGEESKQPVVRDTAEMVSWVSVNQEEIDDVSKNSRDN